MKLLFDKRVLIHKTYTGVENYAKNLLDNLDKRIDINFAEPISMNKYLAHLWTHFILPFEKGDILFCPANIAPIFVPKRKKLVITIHDVAFQTYPKSFSIFFRLYYKLVVPINIKRADAIITVSNSSKHEIERYYLDSKNKITQIYLGIDKEFEVVDLVKKKQILYVGSMNERKNFIGLLKAFELLDNDKYNLLIIGNFSTNFIVNDENKDLIKKMKGRKNIKFKNNVTNNELVTSYCESELFVFPSFYEGFGLPVLEAMACGTPIICSNTTSLPEVGGDAVVYCNPYDIEDIKNKIELVLNDKLLQKEMIKKGLERVKLFSWERSASEHIKVFQEVLKK